MAGLSILKQDLSEEGLCARWIASRYYQLFCGANADPGRSEAERALVDRLRVALERPAVPHPQHDRRRDEGILAAVADTQSRAAASRANSMPLSRGAPRRTSWCPQDNRITWHFIAPGKPMQNGIRESFDGRGCGVKTGPP
jgi:transposase InsO family protein